MRQRCPTMSRKLFYETLKIRRSTFIIAILFVNCNIGSIVPTTNFKTSIRQGHLYVTWTVEKNLHGSKIPISYSINFCPKQLNNVTNPCHVSYAVCTAHYNGLNNSASITGHPYNITKFLTRSNYESINNTIEVSGPFISASWNKRNMMFSCGIFLHKCMDGQFSPWFSYYAIYNGTGKLKVENIDLKSGLPIPAQHVTITTPEPYNQDYFRIKIGWSLLHVCRADIPPLYVRVSYKKNLTVFYEKHLYNMGRKQYSFQVTVDKLAPMQEYLVDIVSDKEIYGTNSTVRKTFKTPEILRTMVPYINVKNIVKDGYVNVTWKMSDLLLTQFNNIVYKIMWCPQNSNPRPHTCKTKSIPVCTATFDGQSQQGSISHDTTSLKKDQDFMKVMSSAVHNRNHQWVISSWEKSTETFTCTLYLNPCQTRTTVNMKYFASYDGQQIISYENSDFINGFNSPPKIKTQDTLTSKNVVQLDILWSYEKVCARNVSTSSIIWLTSKDGEQLTPMKHQVIPHKALNGTIQYKTFFSNLKPYTIYNVHMKGEKQGEIVEKVLTLEGEPNDSPILEPIIYKEDNCIGGLRNQSVQWKLPSPEARNGIIRNIQLLYWKKSNIEEKIIINLNQTQISNTTLYVLKNLQCFVEYDVQIRACLKMNASCSKYSDIQFIKAVAEAITSPKESNGVGNALLWASILIALLVVVLAIMACQYFYRKRNRRPLDELSEDAGRNGYSRAGEVELNVSGSYCVLIDSRDDFLGADFHCDTDRSIT